jgi:hypothetical protein
MEQRYRLQERRGPKFVEVWGFPVHLEGDQDLCERLSTYLQDAIPALTGSYDPDTGERGTRVIALSPGSPGWLESCLRKAAGELSLRLTKVPQRVG